ncbi:MAG: hypothetical protein DRI34_00490 [Deltaproteobacteria bacterium]|nr:MAG: hypothetical protein DRI34_00490 [Deltaproteobacteria bacterium]
MVARFVTVLLLLAAPALAGTGLTLQPERVSAGMFFAGADVVVQARVPRAEQLVFEIRGQQKTYQLKRKGKALGLLWMNVGDLEIKHAPELYLLASSVDCQQLASREELAGQGVGLPALRRQLSSDGRPLTAELFEDFLKLKQSEGLYEFRSGVVEVDGDDAGDVVTTRVVFHLPAKVPLGNHRVRVLAFNQGRGRVLYEKPLTIEQVGAARWITVVAHNHGLLYGIGAVIIALVVGLLTGFLFGLGSKGAH